MEVYQNGEIRIEGINLYILNDFQMREQINEHMSFWLKGEITAETAEEYERKLLLGRELRISSILDGEELLIGYGIVTAAEICAAGDCFGILLRGHSVSYKMTRKKRKRVFQNARYTYGDIMDCVADDRLEIDSGIYKNERLKCPIIQYDETDWELLHRLAGQFHTVLIVDISARVGRVFLGDRNGKSHSLNKESCIHWSFRQKENGERAICCMFEQRKGMKLGDTVFWDNKKWAIVEKETVYVHAAWETRYVLGQLRNWQLPPVRNNALRGASINGTVLTCKKEMLQLWINMDESQTKTDSFWFPYFPETGNIMYAMPEKGADAVLYFPDGDESKGVVTHCFLSDNENLNMWNHTIKKIETPYGKKVEFWPTTIEISGGDDTKTNELYVGEETGVQLISEKPLRLIADGAVTIQSGLSCTVTAANWASLKQGGEQNTVEMYGDRIIVTAEKYTTSSRTHKSKTTALETKKVSQAYPSLYNTFLGIMARGDVGEINGKILGGIPTLGKTTGRSPAQSRTGLHIKRK